MGLAKKQHRPARSKEFVALLFHSKGGRTRFRIRGLYQSPDFGRYLESHLEAHPKVVRVKSKALTGNLQLTTKPYCSVSELREAIEDLVMQAIEARLHNIPLKTLSPFEDTPWQAHEPEALAQNLATDLSRGLSPDEAKRRLVRDGANRLRERPPQSSFQLIAHQFFNLPVGLLASSAVFSLVTGGVLEAGLILGVVGLNGYLGFLTEAKAASTLEALTTSKPGQVVVYRNGKPHTIPSTEVVKGDLLVLKEGDVPCDIRLVTAQNLRIDESALTGESLPVKKDAKRRFDSHTPIAERCNMAFSGTTVTRGSGLGLVVATGDRTQMGYISQLVGTQTTPKSLLDLQIEQLGQRVVWGSMGICGAVFALGLMRGQSPLSLLNGAISLAVAAIPEGLPAVGTTTMAKGLRNLAQRGVYVRSLSTVEALGSLESLCLDKTGTLTLNDMLVCAQKVWPESQKASETWLATIAALCSDTKKVAGQWQGSATEVAIIRHLEEQGIDVEGIRKLWPRLRTRYRSESSAIMYTYHHRPEDELRTLAAKGNPEQVLARCDRYLSKDGIAPLTDEVRTKLLETNHELQDQALRVLGFAFGTYRKELVWVGFMGLKDPLRDGVASVVQKFHAAGIKTRILTGDQERTALAIARELGLSGNGDLGLAPPLESGWLDDHKTAAKVIQNLHVFSRVSPAEKLKIVKALQANGQMTAMTGDGINDTPALKAAHVGIAMGGAGNETAAEAADVVLMEEILDDLLFAIKEGRASRDNIKKAIDFLLSTNLSEILVSFFGMAAGWGPILNPMQLLWINLMTDLFPSLSYAYDQPSHDIMERKPIDPKKPLFSQEEVRNLGEKSLSITIASLIAFKMGKGSPLKGSTMAFTTLSGAQLLQAMSSRWQGNQPFNPYLFGSVGIGASLLGLGVQQGFLRRILKHSPLQMSEWGLSIGLAMMSFLVNERLAQAKKKNDRM